jgi:TRAP-type C4-dicarboxylate transport system permease small subunit
MVAMSIFMTVFGAKLVMATWQNSIADFPGLSVGVTYLPIPLGGVILLLFVVERMFCETLAAPASRH